MDIKVYGKGTSGHQFVVKVISDYLSKAGISFSITEINDVSKFLEKGIESIPAIQLNDEPIISLKSNETFNKSLRDAINHLLASVNYGVIPQFVVPEDFSDTSLNALSYGHRLATDLGAVTKVLHVYKPKPTLDVASEVHIKSEAEYKKQLNDLVKTIDVDWGSDILQASLVSPEFLVGFASEKILEFTTTHKSELVVMGTTGADNLVKKWFGSVSTNVIDNAECPVILVPSSASYKGIKKILLAVEDANNIDIHHDIFTNICNHFDTEIHICHVSNDDSKEIDISAISKRYPKNKIITSVIKSDEVIPGLNQYAMENSIDMITLLHKSKSFISHFLSGSVTEDMSMYSNIPILVLK